MIRRARQAQTHAAIGDPSVYGFIAVEPGKAIRPIVERIARAIERPGLFRHRRGRRVAAGPHRVVHQCRARARLRPLCRRGRRDRLEARGRPPGGPAVPRRPRRRTAAGRDPLLRLGPAAGPAAGRPDPAAAGQGHPPQGLGRMAGGHPGRAAVPSARERHGRRAASGAGADRPVGRAWSCRAAARGPMPISAPSRPCASAACRSTSSAAPRWARSSPPAWPWAGTTASWRPASARPSSTPVPGRHRLPADRHDPG
jgi:hypothetical protein